MSTERKQKIITDIIFYGIIIGLGIAGFRYFFPTLLPFILGFIVASVLRVPVQKLSGGDSKLRRACTIVVGVIFFALVFFLIALLGIQLVEWFLGFLEFVPRLYQNEILPLLNRIFEWAKEKMNIDDADMMARIELVFQNLISTIGSYISSASVKAIGTVTGNIMGIPGLIVKLIVGIISCFFFMLDYDKIIHFMVGLLPKSRAEQLCTFKNYIKNTLLVYVKSYSLLFLLTYVELTIGFQLIGIPYAPIIGILVAVFDILPILGTGGILLPWAAILLFMKEFGMGIGMFVLYLIITIIRNTLEPKLVGKQIGLHPLATLVFLYVGLKAMGIVGMFVFPVTLAVIVNMRREMAEAGESTKTGPEETRTDLTEPIEADTQK